MWRGRALQLLCGLQHRSTTLLASQLQSAFSSTAAPADRLLYAACVLERLPILQPPAPDWEVDYKTFADQAKLNAGQLKQYPAPEAKRASKLDDAQAELRLAPTTTKADHTGATATMKRRLYEKLVLLIKAPPATHGSSGSSDGSGGSSGGTAGSTPVWGFPAAPHQPGESMRAAAERALKEAIGPAQVFFIGNAPMAHLPLPASAGAGSSSGAAGDSSQQEEGSALYFHLAQVLNDPWDVDLHLDGAEDHAWVSLEELPQYISDPQLLELARQWW